jgi:hypothetical protein
MTNVSLFFMIFHSLLPNISICLQYFWDKNPQRSHSDKGESACVKKFACSQHSALMITYTQFEYFFLCIKRVFLLSKRQIQAED